MRIISKFHDYYDTALGYGQDPDLIFRREVRTLHFKSWPYDSKIAEILKLRPFYHDFKPQLTVLGFCGRCYPLWISAELPLTEEALGTSNARGFGMSLQHALSYFKTPSVGMFRRDDEHARVIETALKPLDGAEINPETFRKLDCPIFLAEEHPRSYWNPWHNNSTRPISVRIFTNPRLATLGFAHKLDAYTTFQEIAMFLGSQLAPEDRAPRTVGDDKIIAASKGFDDQSFRTQAPGQKKLNRRINKEKKRGSA